MYYIQKKLVKVKIIEFLKDRYLVTNSISGWHEFFLRSNKYKTIEKWLIYWQLTLLCVGCRIDVKRYNFKLFRQQNRRKVLLVHNCVSIARRKRMKCLRTARRMMIELDVAKSREQYETNVIWINICSSETSGWEREIVAIYLSETFYLNLVENWDIFYYLKLIKDCLFNFFPIPKEFSFFVVC